MPLCLDELKKRFLQITMLLTFFRWDITLWSSDVERFELEHFTHGCFQYVRGFFCATELQRTNNYCTLISTYQFNQCSIQSAFLCDSHTKNHNDPQNRKQGVKNDPLPFLWKSQVFGPHKQNNDISHDIDYQELQTFMIQTKYRPIYCIQFWFAFIL